MILTICFSESILLLDHLFSIILHLLSHLINLCSISIFTLIFLSSLFHSSSSHWSLLSFDFHSHSLEFFHLSRSFTISNHFSHLNDLCSILTFTFIFSSFFTCLTLLLYWIISIISLIFARFWHSFSFSRVLSSLSHSSTILNHLSYLINSFSISIFTRIQFSFLFTLLIWFSILICFWYILLILLTYSFFFNLFLFILFISCISSLYSRNLSINVINLSDIISLHSLDIMNYLSHLLNHVQIYWSILILFFWWTS